MADEDVPPPWDLDGWRDVHTRVSATAWLVLDHVASETGYSRAQIIDALLRHEPAQLVVERVREQVVRDGCARAAWARGG